MIVGGGLGSSSGVSWERYCFLGATERCVDGDYEIVRSMIRKRERTRDSETAIR